MPTPQADPGPQLLHPMFQDHAVLQRDRPISVYGDTTPGAAVTVSLGTVSAEARAMRRTLARDAAGDDGWRPLHAHRDGEWRDQDARATCSSGDVFLCAGQSNMAFTQRQARGRGGRRPHGHRRADPPPHRSRPPPASRRVRSFARNPRWVVASPGHSGGLLGRLLLLCARVEEDRERARSAWSTPHTAARGCGPS